MRIATTALTGIALGTTMLLGACAPTTTPAENPTPAESSAPVAATLLDAVKLNDAAQVKAFLDAGEDPNTVTNGVPLIHVAALGDYAEAGRALIEGGADINARSGSVGATPIIVAAESPGTEMLTVLLDAGADLSLGENTGPAAGAMQAAARAGNVEALEILVTSGIGVDDKGPAKSTALIWAAYFGHLEAVEYLIGHGADLTEVDVAGQDALRNAELGGFPEVAEYIRQAMVDQGLA